MKTNYIKYFLALLLFGSNGIVASQIHLTSYEIVFWRTMLGSILLLALLFLGKQKLTFYRNKKELFFIGLSGIAMGTSWIFLYEAYAEIGVSLASLAYYCGPVIVMVLSPFVFKEKLTAEKIAAFLMVLVGIVFVNGTAGAESINRIGLICGFLAAVMYSLMVMLNKQAKRITGLENSAIQLFVSFLTVAVYVGFKTGYALSVKTADLPWIVVLGLLNTGIGCYFYFSSIGSLPVQTVAICGYLEPLSAVILSVLLLNETLSATQVFGAALMIGGALFGELWGGRKHSEHKIYSVSHLQKQNKSQNP